MIAGTACPQAAKPFLLACMIVGLWPAAAEAAGLADQLQGLATESGFAIEGLERLSDEPARRAEGSVKDRLQTLLQGYNYVLAESRPGNIERLVITGIARSGGRPPPSSTIPTLRVAAPITRWKPSWSARTGFHKPCLSWSIQARRPWCCRPR